MVRDNKSIKRYFITTLSFVLISVLLIAFSGTIYIVRKSIKTIKEESITSNLKYSTEIVELKIKESFSIIKNIADNEFIANDSISFEEKKSLLIEYVKKYNLGSIGIAGKDGVLRGTDGFENSISERQYYKDLMNDGLYISNPIYNEKSNTQIIFIGLPLKYNNEIVGIITGTFDSSYLSEEIKELKYNNLGISFIIDKNGTVIASDELEKVNNNYNPIELVAKDSSYEKEAQLFNEILSKEAGIVAYDGNEKLYIAYKEIPSSDGWKMVFQVEKKVIHSELYSLMEYFGIIVILAVVIMIFAIFQIGDKIGARLESLKKKIEILESGNLAINFEEKELENNDEIGLINRALLNTTRSIKYTLKIISNNIGTLNEKSKALTITSEDITLGAKTISASMNETSEGNEEQSLEILKIHRAMELFKVNIEKMNEDVKNVFKISNLAENKVSYGRQEMEELSKSLNEFNTKFNEFNENINSMNRKISSINGITTTIKQISEQTNLLALNAAIEAARAGDAGKGFSVVADEIRHLAEQSQKSVSEIGLIISNVLSEGNNIISSTSIINEVVITQKETIKNTISSFKEITEAFDEIIPKIEGIAEKSSENSQGILSILDSIEATTYISQELAANTEEVAATSNEFNSTSREISDVSKNLAEISRKLSEEINKFNIN